MNTQHDITVSGKPLNPPKPPAKPHMLLSTPKPPASTPISANSWKSACRSPT